MEDKIPSVTMKEVPASTIMPKNPKKTIEDLPDVIRMNEPFWFLYDNGSRYNAYKKGVMIGSYAEARCNTGTVFEMFFEVFKVVLRAISEDEDHQIAEFDNHLKLMKNMFDLIEDSVDTTLKSDILGEELFAEMYGAFVGYMERNLKD
jgi:hypothetical protein